MLLITLLSGNLLLSLSTPVFAEANKGLTSEISLSVGWERLEYEEHEPVTRIESAAETNNVVLGVEGLKRWKHLFCGAKSVFPVVIGDDREKVTLSGTAYQTNTLELRWIRIDGFVGYPMSNWANPYFGVRWSEIKQERTDFIVMGTPINLMAVERIRYWSLLLGIRGMGNLTPRLEWNYSAEFLIPLEVEVTNTALPGFKASDRSGYTFELKGEIDYVVRETILLGFLLYGGQIHWDGSDWKPFDGGLAKWPENDTYYYGLGLKFSYRF